MKKDIEKQASLWLIEQKEGLSKIRQSEFDVWIQNELNKKSYDALNKMEKQISFISQDFKEQLRNEVYEELEEESVSFKPYLVAASILLIAFIGIFSFNTSSKVLYSKVLESKYTVQKDIVLPDNTVVSLDAKTKMNIKYFDDRREVTLLQGSVMFDIGEDKKRPFIIYTKRNTIEEIGTSFEVSIRDEITTVKVKEGIVRIGQIYNTDKDFHILYVLEKEEGLSLTKYGKATNPRKVSLDEIGIWEDNNIIFNDMPLTKALDEFMRYTSQQVEIDSRLTHIKVTGKFKTDELENFVNSLTLIYPIQIEKNDLYLFLKKSS